jgi:hypothetical protein
MDVQKSASAKDFQIPWNFLGETALAGNFLRHWPHEKTQRGRSTFSEMLSVPLFATVAVGATS